jgi:hypothetical protein
MLKIISQNFWTDLNIKVFCLIELTLLYLNYFYNLYLISLGKEASIEYQYFLIFIFLFNVLFLLFGKKKYFVFKKSHLVFLFFSVLTLLNSINYIEFNKEICYLITTTFLPFLVFFIISNLLKDKSNKTRKAVILFFIYYFLLRALVYLILIPLELSTSGKLGVHNLQFSGGQYHNIAILMLIILAITYLNSNTFNLRYEQFFAWSLYVITIFLSYSRVGILLLLIYLFVYFIIIAQNKLKHYFAIGLASLIFSNFINFINFNDSLFFQYWISRLNIDPENLMTNSAHQAIFYSNENDNLRSTILEIGFERNFFETFFGTGIGTTPLFLSLKTHGEIALGSFHNFFGTILFERGIIILILAVAFFINILFKIFLEREKKLDMFLKYAIFIIFITTTGAELFVNSRDFNVDMIVCLLFFELSLDPKMRNSFNKI